MQPDPERIAVAWAKANATIGARVGGPGDAARIATRLPGPRRVNGKEVAGWDDTFLRVFAIPGAGYSVSETSDIAGVLLQWDAYAKSANESPDYGAASLLARTVADEMFRAEDVAIAGEGQLVTFGTLTVPRRVEEPEAGWARYLLEATIVVRPIP